VAEESKEDQVSEEDPAQVDEMPTVAPAAPEAPRSKAFKIEREREKKKLTIFKRFAGRWPTAMRVDALCLLAAILGLMSLGMPPHSTTGRIASRSFCRSSLQKSLSTSRQSISRGMDTSTLATSS
jgi:hypothetical protein